MKRMVKKDNGNKLIVLNMFWSVIAVAVNYVITFLMTSYVTNTAGAEAYGFVTLSNTLTSYIDVFSIALNAFACRYISISFHKGNIKEANRYFNSVIVADVVLSAIILMIGIPAIYKLETFLNISDELVFDVKVLFLLTVFRYIITITGTAFSVGTFITNKIRFSERQKSISYLIQGVFLLAFFALLPTRIWYVGIAMFLAALYVFITNIYYTHKFTGELKIEIKKFEIKAVKKLISLGIWNSINNFGNILNSGLDLVITNIMLSPVTMGEISIGKSLGTICNSLLESIANSFRPRLLQSYAAGDTAGLISDLKKAMKVTGTLANIILAGFIACGMDLYRLWLPTQDTQFLYIISIIVLFSDIIVGAVKPLYYVFTLTKKLKVPCFITIGMGVLNVTSMYLLISYTNLGAYAVVLTTLVLNFMHFFDTPIYAAYCLKMKWTTFYPTIIEHFVACALQVGAIYLISVNLSICDTWLMFIIKCSLIGFIEIGINAVIVFFEILLKKNITHK